jgi:peptide deformylase
MTKNDIITLPNPVLRQKSKRVGFVDAEVEQLAQAMVEATLDWEDSRQHETGAALAAVQLGKLLRVVVIRNDFEDKGQREFTVFINPEITKVEGEPIEDLEGCLSVESLYGTVARYPKVKVKAKDLEGREIRVTATGFLARVFQHEIDHTNGIVFVDRITDHKKLMRLQPDGTFVHVKADD